MRPPHDSSSVLALAIASGCRSFLTSVSSTATLATAPAISRPAGVPGTKDRLSDGGGNYGYDVVGNIVGKTGPARNVVWTSTYDAFGNRHSEAILPAGALAMTIVSGNGACRVAATFGRWGDAGDLFAETN